MSSVFYRLRNRYPIIGGLDLPVAGGRTDFGFPFGKTYNNFYSLYFNLSKGDRYIRFSFQSASR